MRVVVSGSTGLIGRALVRRLEESSDEVIRLVRPTSRGPADGIVWDPESGRLNAADLEGVDAVVHLAGENIADRRWTESQKRRIRDSRVKGTALLSEALASLTDRPSVFACASAAGIYGDRGAERLQDCSPPGSDFLAEATSAWEDSTDPAALARMRVVKMRIGIVLSASAGMLKRVLPIFRLGLGGRLGSGAQYMSWISRADLVEAIAWTLKQEAISGTVNFSSPNPATNAEFTKELGRVVHRPAPFFVPRLALRIAQGEITDAVLASVRMVPEKLEDSGFEFQHPTLTRALEWAVGDVGQ